MEIYEAMRTTFAATTGIGKPVKQLINRNETPKRVAPRQTLSREPGLADNSQNDQKEVVVCALYHFVNIDDYQALQQSLLSLLKDNGVKGTLLVAAEGINGTVAGTSAGIKSLQAFLASDGRFDGIAYKLSTAEEMPFPRTRVKLKKEIVTMGITDIDPRQIVGTYVKAKEWNELISDPEVTVIDTRNEYEVLIGTFENAINPHTESFREFPGFAESELNPNRHKKIAMFCTGGIRCEKSTAFLKSKGFDEVYHLEGGILKYLEDVPKGRITVARRVLCL